MRRWVLVVGVLAGLALSSNPAMARGPVRRALGWRYGARPAVHVRAAVPRYGYGRPGYMVGRPGVTVGVGVY